MIAGPPLAAAEKFASLGRVADIREYGSGNVNDTFLVTVDAPGEKRFILQRLNTRVFPRPQLIMQNLRTLTAHIRVRLGRDSLPGGCSWEVPLVLCTREGRDHWLDNMGSFWRALSFIEDAQSFDTLQNPEQAREVGYALGMFHHLLSDLPPGTLADTLPEFHHTPVYLENYDRWLREAASSSKAIDSPEVDYCLRFIKERRAWAGVLEEAKARGRLAIRPMHGDPKVNNVLMDRDSCRAVSLVDLDTVKPGLVHYDLGDLLRSGCNPLGEEWERWEEVRFDPELCRAILKGYLSLARSFLTDHDYAYFYDAIRLLPFELGLRFFTDFLAGNVYFKARRREHNLVRALVQFKLTESIEAQETGVRAIIRELGR